MPSKPLLVPTSITTFYTSHRSGRSHLDEVFLLYSRGFEDGRARGLYRDGIGSPWMWDEDIRRRITDPEEQRRGTWMIDRGIALEIERVAIESKRNKPEVLEWIRRDTGRDPHQALDEWLRELDSTPDYIAEFEKEYGSQGYKLVGMQGCGNLTMNGWFVGFLNSDFTKNHPVFLYRREEPCETRQYTCFVKYRDTKSFSVELLKFNLYKKKGIQNNGKR